MSLFPLNSNTIRPNMHNLPSQPSIHLMKFYKENSINFTITQTTIAPKHCTDPDDIMYNVSGITFFHQQLVALLFLT